MAVFGQTGRRRARRRLNIEKAADRQMAPVSRIAFFAGALNDIYVSGNLIALSARGR